MLASPIPYTKHGITAQAAYARLRAQARTERRKLAIVSADVVRAAVNDA